MRGFLGVFSPKTLCHALPLELRMGNLKRISENLCDKPGHVLLISNQSKQIFLMYTSN